MFKENFIKSCNKAGKTPTAVCAEIGLSNAAYSKWDKKSVPHRATLLKIADYFGVPADTLLESEGNPPEDARLISLIKTLTAEEKNRAGEFYKLSYKEKEVIPMCIIAARRKSPGKKQATILIIHGRKYRKYEVLNADFAENPQNKKIRRGKSLSLFKPYCPKSALFSAAEEKSHSS